MRVAILIETFPSKTEVPVLNQICGLIDAGVQVKIFALNKGKIDANQLHKKILDYKLLEKTFFLGEVPNLDNSPRILNAIYWRWEGFRRSFFTLVKYPRVFRNALFKKEYGRTRKAFRVIFAVYPLLGLHENYDIIHCQFAPMGIWGCILRDLGILNGKVFTSFRGYGINDLPKRVESDYYDFLIKKGDAFSANTDYTKNNAVKLGFDSTKINIIHSCIDIKDFPFKKKRYARNETLEILSVASLREVKGLQYSISAMELLKRSHPDVKFRYSIVGEGPLKTELTNLIKANQLEEQVALLGYKPQQELIHLYKKTHLFILPSITTKDGNAEAQGLVLQEAQACGIPVIGSKAGGIPEGFLPGKSGFLVEEKNAKGIHEAIIKFVDQPELITQMGVEGLKFLKDRFDVKVQTENLIKVYQKLYKSTSDQ